MYQEQPGYGGAYYGPSGQAEVAYAEICRGIESLDVPEMARIDLIDVYEGEGIPPGRLSLTLRFTFLDREKTLTVDRVQGFSDNILTFLKNSFGAVIR